MANPNIVNVSDIRANTAVVNVATTMTAVVVNAGGSNKVYKVNALYISNIEGANNLNANVAIERSGFEYALASSIEIPYKSTLDVISKAVYLLEGDTLKCQSDSDANLIAICSFEEIS